MSAYFDVTPHFHATRQGKVGLPICYYNTAAVFASFLVEPERARAVLPAELEPVLVAPGRALATIAFFHYADSSVGPYNEMGLAVGARPSRARGFRDTAGWRPWQSLLPGMYVVDLPVTTEIANAAGREIWGYPKIVVPIDFQLRGADIDCAVHDSDGSLLCRLKGRRGNGLALPASNLVTFTRRGDRLLRTVIDMRGRMSNGGAGSVRLDGAASDHPLCRHLRGLDLPGRAPRLLQAGLGLRALLPAGEAVR